MISKVSFYLMVNICFWNLINIINIMHFKHFFWGLFTQQYFLKNSLICLTILPASERESWLLLTLARELKENCDVDYTMTSITVTTAEVTNASCHLPHRGEIHDESCYKSLLVMVEVTSTEIQDQIRWGRINK